MYNTPTLNVSTVHNSCFDSEKNGKKNFEKLTEVIHTLTAPQFLLS